MKIKGLLTLSVAVAIVFSMIAPAAAVSGNETDYWLEVNSPGSYCGYNYGFVYNVGGNLNVAGGAQVFNPNPCSPTGSTIGLPAGYLSTSAVAHCYINGQDTVAWASPLKYNSAGSGIITVGNTSDNLCGPGPFGPGEPWVRLVVSSSYYVYPTGWQTHTTTTHWVTPG